MSGFLLDYYDIVRMLSSGTYGVVFLGRRKADGKEFALKFFGYTDKEPEVGNILREIGNLRTLSGIKAVVDVVATFNDTPDGLLVETGLCPKKFRRSYPIIVMDILSGGDLFDRLRLKSLSKQVYSECNAAVIFRSFIEGLTQIHEKDGMINIDLKLENLMFSSKTDDNQIKIIDFGMAVNLWDRHEHFEKKVLGTPFYYAPETLESYVKNGQSIYSRATDVWQAGCILYLLLTLKYPFGRENGPLNELYANIRSGRYRALEQRVSPAARELVVKIFNLDPSQRPTAREILDDPWLRDTKSQSSEDFGSEFQARLKAWNYRKQFKQCIHFSEVENMKRHTMFIAAMRGIDSPRREFMLECQSSNIRGDTLRTVPSDPEVHTGAPQPQIVQITADTIRELRRRYIALLVAFDESALSNIDENGRPAVTPRVALHHSGMSFENFCRIVSAAGCDYLANHEVFAIFDWDSNGTVNYKEFLLTLTSFRTDKAAADSASLYFEVFDVDGSGSISKDELLTVMHMMLDGGDEMLQDPTFRSLFDDVDVNADGTISIEEFSCFFETMTNHSSFLSRTSSPKFAHRHLGNLGVPDESTVTVGRLPSSLSMSDPAAAAVILKPTGSANSMEPRSAPTQNSVGQQPEACLAFGGYASERTDSGFSSVVRVLLDNSLDSFSDDVDVPATKRSKPSA